MDYFEKVDIRFSALILELYSRLEILHPPCHKTYNPGQKIWNKKKKRNPIKLDRTRKVWYLLLRVFCLLLPKFNFWNGDWALGYVSTQIWDFPNISLFPKILLSLKSCGNPWGNSYTKFAILDVTFRFTFG